MAQHNTGPGRCCQAHAPPRDSISHGSISSVDPGRGRHRGGSLGGRPCLVPPSPGTVKGGPAKAPRRGLGRHRVGSAHRRDDARRAPTIHAPRCAAPLNDTLCTSGVGRHSSAEPCAARLQSALLHLGGVDALYDALNECEAHGVGDSSSVATGGERVLLWAAANLTVHGAKAIPEELERIRLTCLCQLIPPRNSAQGE